MSPATTRSTSPPLNRPPHSTQALLTAVALAAVALSATLLGAGTQKQPQVQKGGDLPIRPAPVLPGVYVESASALPSDAGEVQSTTIPPGLNPRCPAGRLLISDDSQKNPGKVVFYDLDDLRGTPRSATIEPLPSADYRIQSNDHDLVTLKNGEVLLMRMGQSRAPLQPKPRWYEHAWKLDKDGAPDPFGPGVRSALFVWRSTDGGNSFKFLSLIDTARIDDDWQGLTTSSTATVNDGSGGLPQYPSSSHSPGSAENPLWQMGGTDGPLATVDPVTGRVFVTIGLVGYIPDALQSAFKLTGQPLPRTHVAMSADRGITWKKAGNLGFRAWRLEVVPRSGDRLSFAASVWDPSSQEGFTFVDHAKVGNFPSLATDHITFAAPERQGQWGWSRRPWENPILFKKEKGPTDSMGTNVACQPLLTRSPSSSHLLVVYPDTLENGQGDGYRVYLYKNDPSWTAMPPIAPQVPGKDNFILHVTAVDPGSGPMLLYWYDVDAAARTATIRGRLILADDRWTSDFSISRSGLQSRSFSVVNTRWYGDYHTAGAFRRNPRLGQLTAYEFYPVWVEPDGDVHFARVRYVEAAVPKTAAHGPLRPTDSGLPPRMPVARKVLPARLQIIDGVGVDED